MKKFQLFKSFLSVLVIGSLLISCNDPNDTGWEFSPNMYNSRAYEPQTQIALNKYNPGGSNMRLPAAGTVSRRNYNTKYTSSDSTVSEDLLIYDFGKDGISKAANVPNPIQWSESVEEEGKVLYERYCQHCHGATGAGDGKVAAKYKGVPNYSSDALKNLSGGHIFHVITYGKGRMWAHGAQMNPDERWKIAHYVARLQIGG